MTAFLDTMRSIIEAMLYIVDSMPDLVALTIVSIVSGVVMLGVFALVTPPHWLKRSRELMTAAMYEIRLYLDSPRRVLASQARLVGWSVAYTAAMLPAFIVLGIPFGLLLLHLEARWGIEELPTNQPILVRVDLNEPLDVSAADGDGVKVTAPVLMDRTEKQAWVRVELTEPKTTTLKLTVGETEVEKVLDGDPDSVAYSPDRARGLDLLIAFTVEPPIEHPQVQRIHVDHPAAEQDWIPFAMPWWLYWLIIATLAAIALHKPLRVTL